MFSSCPYLAMVLLVIGTAARLAWARPRPASAIDPPHVGRARGGSAIWRGALVLLIVGHLAGLLAPGALLLWDRSPARLVLLELVALLAGVVALVGWAGRTWRRLRTPLGSAVIDVCDSAFRALLLVAVASGVLLAAFHRWGSWWGPTALAPYLVSLARGHPDAERMSAMPFLVQLHLFTAFAAAALLPWTDAGGRWAASIRRAAARAAAGLAPARLALQARLRRLDPAPRIWPDED